MIVTSQRLGNIKCLSIVVKGKCSATCVHKKIGLPCIDIVEGRKIAHPLLIQEERARMKIMLLDPRIDLPITTINSILNDAINLYK
jgi:hypothetical protein